MLKAVAFVSASFSAQVFAAFFAQWLGIVLPPSQLPVITVTAYINSAEIFFNLIAVCLCGIWVYDLRRSSLMHINLKFVCYLIAFHMSTSCFLEIIFIIDKFTNIQYIPSPLKLILVVIHGTARMHFTLDPPMAAIERCLATLKVANYENAISSRKQWIALMFAKEVFGIVTYYVFTAATAGAIVFALFWMFLLTLTVIIGITLYRVNLRSYKTRIGTLHLTVRYQTVENIRCLKPVLIYSFLAVAQNISAFVLLIFMIIYYNSDNITVAYVIEAVINIIVSIFCICAILSFLGFSSRVRKFLKKTLKFHSKSRISSSTAAKPVLSVMGKILTTENEQNLYFTQFNKAWK